jgi:lincosamide nucleotidyltransferase A/C/D/E
VNDYVMPAAEAVHVVTGLATGGVDVWLGGGWAVDALVGRQTRKHSDLDLWVEAPGLEGLIVVLAGLGIDRVLPWGGDRPWNFVLHDGVSRRVDLHLFERLDGRRLHYGSVTSPFHFSADDLGGEGEIAGTPVGCESPAFALRNHTGYPPRDVDRHDVRLLCAHFGLDAPGR